ncbi:MAG: type I-E CRISPR-associated protein Cse2/CasB [Nannocystaceae bacterium]
MTEPTPDETKRHRRTVVYQIAARLADDSAIGERASLRRLNYASPESPAFWKITVRDLDPLMPALERGRELHERRWAAILRGLAEVAGAGLHAPGRRLGEAVAAAKIDEARFVKLLRAHGDALLDLVRPLAHQLISKGEPVDWDDVARLVLSDGVPDEDERTRRDLARFYYSTTYKMSATTQEPTA